MGMVVGSMGVVVCWLLLEEASVLIEMKRLGKMERRPTRGESEGEWQLEKGTVEREAMWKWGL
jgi:hypothetical protein